MNELGKLLDALGRDLTEHLSLNKRVNGHFESQVVTVADITERGVDPNGERWYGTAALNPRVIGGRGTAADVVGIRELFCDLDVKPGGMPDWDTARQVIDTLAGMLGVGPVAVVNSGHGLQPHWRLERSDRTDWTDEADRRWGDAVALLRRWGRLVTSVAERYGGHVDNVYDVSRVLRAPGTVNHKTEPVPVTVEWNDAAPVSVGRVLEVLDEYGIDELDGDRDELGETIAPPTGWRWADTTCGYVATMTTAWASDTPPNRHNWDGGQCVRLACAHRLGCITADDHEAAKARLDERVATLRTQTGDPVQRHETANWMAWAVDKVATFTDDRARSELGNHQHDTPDPPPTKPAPAVQPVELADAHEVFRRWLGAEYDLDALDTTLAVGAAEQLDGDPVWLLVLSGSGNAKTETVQALAGAGAHIKSTLTGEAALLSGTSRKERAKDAHGGILRQIGDHGLLVIKDVTSILSMNRDARSQIIAALREIHDGHWVRDMGGEGGRTLEWKGRIGIIGAVTTAWDRAHDVVASMGDRFVILRMDSTSGRLPAGRKAIGNTSHETTMRTELAAAAAGVLAGVDSAHAITVTDDETELLLAAADLVTLARTGVDYDYRGKVIDSHAPEMPTRFAKELTQVVRGAVAIGMDRTDAMRLAIRCARDSMPPLRLQILDDVAANPGTGAAAVRKRLEKPWSTIDRQLQSLYILGVLSCEEIEDVKGWRYRLADGIDPTALVSPDLSPPSPRTPKEKEERERNDTPREPFPMPPSDKSGERHDDPDITHARRLNLGELGERDPDDPDPWF